MVVVSVKLTYALLGLIAAWNSVQLQPRWPDFSHWEQTPWSTRQQNTSGVLYGAYSQASFFPLPFLSFIALTTAATMALRLVPPMMVLPWESTLGEEEDDSPVPDGDDP